MEFNLTKGLDLSLKGEITNQDLPNEKNLTSRVALLGTDFHGIRPTMFVAEGQEVRQGEKLFEDKKNPGYSHLSPINGKIIEINNIAFKVEKNIPRCVAINLTPNTDDNSLDLLKSLKKTYNHFDMGVYLTALDNGQLNIGNNVSVK